MTAPFTPASILAGPHLRTLVDIGEDGPVLMVEPLRFIPVLYATDTNHGAVPPRRGAATVTKPPVAARSPEQLS